MYCGDLKAVIEATLGEHTNGRHQTKDASREVRNLAYEIAASGLITKCPGGRSSPFQPKDILRRGGKLLRGSIKRFNDGVFEHQWEEKSLDHAATTPIGVLDDIVTRDDGADD